MDQKRVNEIIKEHKLWLSSNKTKGKQANFSKKRLNNINFHKADLREALFHRADLHGSNFIDAKLEGASFKDCYLTWSNLKGADLRNANLEGSFLWAAFTREANFPEKKLNLGSLYELSNIYFDFRKKVILLTKISRFRTISFIEAETGILHKDMPIWIKYSMREL